MTPCTWTLNIPGWHPTPLNKLLGHWAKAGRLKSHDKEIIGKAVMAGGIPEAFAKRKIELLIIHPPGKRFCDPDAYSKSLLDALTANKVLFNDSHQWVEMDRPEFARGKVLRTVITITE